MINNTMCTITHTTTANPLAWYSVPFEYVTELNVPQIAVKYDDTDLTYGSDYTVGVSGLQLLIESEAGKTLVITRTSPFTQETDYQTGLIVPDEVEDSFDLCAMRDQELRRDLDEANEVLVDHEGRITDIEAVIPEEATSENQLADKAYVDSAVSTFQDAIDAKQDIIEDLSDIRSGAAAGATAVQPGDLGTAASADSTDFATASQGAKADTAVQPGDLATVATTGSYNDLTDKPTVPGGQVNSDWNASSGVAEILNKPTLGTMAAESASDYTKTASLATVATTGSYNDLTDKPSAPGGQVNSDWNATSGVAEILNKPSLATVATSGSYTDLSNTPTLGTMAAESASDYTKTASLATVATSGSYNDLTNTPTIPTATTSLADLTDDVAISTPTDGQVLKYDGTASKWVNSAAPSSSSALANCVTEIPQDIKLELNEGVLTLKAGSKVCIPNGFEQDGVTPKFDFITIDSDLTYSGYTGWTGVLFIMYNSNGLQSIQPGITTSGTTIPTTGCLYNTSTNKITKYVSGSITQDNLSFPICIINQAVESTITNIDQVFNGTGYIGSRIFFLPGVKALAPNGLNEDGSLKNTLLTTSGVIVCVVNVSNINNVSFCISNSVLKYKRYAGYKYDPVTNTDNIGDGNVHTPLVTVNVGSNLTITSFKQKQVFHATDYNDFKLVLDHSIVDFQLPTSSNNYTWYRKYADGWVEQGGLATIPSRTGSGSATKLISFPITMADANYTGQVSYQNGGNGYAQSGITFTNKSVSAAIVSYYTDITGTTDAFLVGWEIKGMAA